MPRSIEPGTAYETWLPFDADKPESTRPTFLVAHQSGRSWKRLAAIGDELGKYESAVDALDKLYDLLFESLRGWRNMVDPSSLIEDPEHSIGIEIPFSRGNMDRVLNNYDAWELYWCLMSGAEPTGAELGNLESPSPSDADDSADDAVVASASMLQRNGNPPSSSAPVAEVWAANAASTGE